MRTMSQQHTQHRRTRLTRRAFAAASALALAGAVAAAAGAPALAAVDPASVDDGLWYYTRTGVAEAHQQTTGQGITIAVLDTMINPAVPDLAGASLQVLGTCRAADGTSLPPTSTDVDARHGTQVTTVIAGTGAGTGGQPGVRGVAPGATVIHVAIEPPGYNSDGPIMGQGCETPDGADPGYEITEAIDQAIAAGADIITTSIGGLWADGSVDALLRAYAADVIVLAAAPNEMTPGGMMMDPGDLNGVVNVGMHDIDGAIPQSLPPNGDYLAVVAPGVAIRTPQSVDGAWDRYGLSFGTSYATPWTAGVLALAWSLHPDATANQMIQALIHTTTTTPEGGEPVHDDQYGYGPVSVPRLMAVDPTTFPDENPLLHPADDNEARPTTAAILEATGKAVPEDTAEPTTEPTTTAPADDQADDDTDKSGTLPLPAILGGAALLLAAAITTAVLLRRRTTTSTTGEGA